MMDCPHDSLRFDVLRVVYINSLGLSIFLVIQEREDAFESQ